MQITCNYCQADAELVDGGVIYPHLNYFNKNGKRVPVHHFHFWRCLPCDAFIGTHQNSPTHEPLGFLANKELRQIRMKTHAIFDPIWKLKMMTRSEAYKWLSGLLEIDPKDCHIGMFNIDMCRKTIDAITVTFNNLLVNGVKSG